MFKEDPFTRTSLQHDWLWLSEGASNSRREHAIVGRDDHETIVRHSQAGVRLDGRQGLAVARTNKSFYQLKNECRHYWWSNWRHKRLKEKDSSAFSTTVLPLFRAFPYRLGDAELQISSHPCQQSACWHGSTALWPHQRQTSSMLLKKKINIRTISIDKKWVNNENDWNMIEISEI